MPFRPPVHQPLRGSAAERRAEYGRERGSAAARGYDAAWRRFRASFIAANPLCADCFERGRLTPSNEVHHMAKLRGHPEQRLDPAACRALCRPCHSARTARGE